MNYYYESIFLIKKMNIRFNYILKNNIDNAET